MDADPLYHVKQLFHQGAYKACIDEASTQPLTPGSEEPALQRAIYVARSYLALRPPQVDQALSVLAPFTTLEVVPTPARAAEALAKYIQTGSEDVVENVRDIVIEVEGEESSDEGLVRALAGTVFILAGEREEAVATLNDGAGHDDLECLALLTQLLLSLDRRDLAQSTFAHAKAIGNDSALVQAIEAWIGLKTGARPLHQAYYYYEELYQLPGGRTPGVLAAHAAAHLLLGHEDEAKADIADAEGQDPNNEDVLAVATALGDNVAAAKLATTKHPLAADLAAKSAAFDEAAAKFVSASA